MENAELKIDNTEDIQPVEAVEAGEVLEISDAEVIAALEEIEAKVIAQLPTEEADVTDKEAVLAQAA